MITMSGVQVLLVNCELFLHFPLICTVCEAFASHTQENYLLAGNYNPPPGFNYDWTSWDQDNQIQVCGQLCCLLMGWPKAMYSIP